MAVWGMGIVAAPILGPTVGGWLTENYSWRWVFYINLPVGLVSLVMQELLGFPAQTAGFWSSPRGVGTMLFMLLTGYLLGRRWDPRLLLAVAPSRWVRFRCDRWATPRASSA
jgi:MFS family permease